MGENQLKEPNPKIYFIHISYAKLCKIFATARVTTTLSEPKVRNLTLSLTWCQGNHNFREGSV